MDKFKHLLSLKIVIDKKYIRKYIHFIPILISHNSDAYHFKFIHKSFNCSKTGTGIRINIQPVKLERIN